MILAGDTDMSFNDFFWMQGRPGLFFAVQAGAAAAANVVAVRMLERRGHHVGFGRFMRIGAPFTLLAVTAAILFLWVFLKIIP